MKKINPAIFKTIQFTVDLIILNFAFIISFYLILNSFTGLFKQAYLVLFIQINLYWILSTFLMRSRFFPIHYRVVLIIRITILQILLHFLLVSTVFAFQKFTFIPRAQIISTYIILFPLFLFWRIFYINYLRNLHKKGLNNKNIIIVGYGDLTEKIIKYFKSFPGYGFNIIGIFDNNSENASQGDVKNICGFLEKNEVDEIYLCLPYLNDDEIQKIIGYGENHHLKIKVIPNFNAIRYKGLSLEKYEDIPVIDITAFPLEEFKNKVTKRSMDIIGSFIFLTFIASWLFPIIAVFIKFESKGPVFFKQNRHGRFDKPFKCYKFRTMVINNESDSKQASRNDPRITRIGTLLRKTSIDEIPQFLNVLKGDMSIIGPRPHPIALNQSFTPLIESFEYRHLIKPGITGLAQAKGYRGETTTTKSMSDRVKMDNFYISHWSILFDVEILFSTFTSLIKFRKKVF